jgi:hypothetical protein
LNARHLDNVVLKFNLPLFWGEVLHSQTAQWAEKFFLKKGKGKDLNIEKDHLRISTSENRG